MDGLRVLSSNGGNAEGSSIKDIVGGVRPVVSLKPEVQFKPAAQKINETTTWDISI